jgi:hypothetical protein
MSSLQWRPEALTDTFANLIAQFCELEGLRERVRKAELARGSRRVDRRKRMRIRRVDRRKPLTAARA